MTILTDEHWMHCAMALAHQAASLGEVPVGAVLVHENRVIGEGHNFSIAQEDPSAHAEIIALRQGGKYLSNYRMPGTTLYVTLEPCIMCAGAIAHSRVGRLVFGAYDHKRGAVGSQLDVIAILDPKRRMSVTSGILESACADLLKDFFLARRREKQDFKKFSQERDSKNNKTFAGDELMTSINLLHPNNI